jgi:hypothetical protein
MVVNVVVVKFPLSIDGTSDEGSGGALTVGGSQAIVVGRRYDASLPNAAVDEDCLLAPSEVFKGEGCLIS